MFTGNSESFPEQTVSWENKFQPDRTCKTIILYHELLIIGTNSQIPLLYKLIFN